MYSDDEIDNRERRGLRHVDAIEERCGTSEQRDEPHEDKANLVAHEQPVAGKNGEARKNRRRDFRAQAEVREPSEGNLENVKQQMVVDVIFGTEGRQRQPDELRRKVMTANALPKQPAPLDVIVAVKITTTYRPCRKLQAPDQQA